MGKKTGIAWADHTFNPWIGCQKVSEGCRNCYAERDNNLRKWVGEWGKDYRRTSEQNWKKPIQWAKQAVKEGVTRRVFCASLADVFDANVTEYWRMKLWELIYDTQQIGGLEWLILTKRPENISTRIPTIFNNHNSSVRMGITVENKKEMRRIPDLFRVWQGNNFISIEPQLEKIYLGLSSMWAGNLDWIICGSESGANARPFDMDWARSLRDECLQVGIPFFLKQAPVGGKLTVLPELDGKAWDQFPERASHV